MIHTTTESFIEFKARQRAIERGEICAKCGGRMIEWSPAPYCVKCGTIAKKEKGNY